MLRASASSCVIENLLVLDSLMEVFWENLERFITCLLSFQNMMHLNFGFIIIITLDSYCNPPVVGNCNFLIITRLMLQFIYK